MNGHGARRVHWSSLRDFYVQVFRSVGVPADLAELPARVLLEADLVGNRTHGMRRLPSYVDRLRRGGTTAAARPEVSERGGVVRVDGHNALGQVVGHQLMEEVSAQADHRGYCLGFARNSNHAGALGYYPKLAASRNQIGIFVSGGASNIAPPGGTRAVLGNNPWSVAIPFSEFPIVMDLAPGETITDYLQAVQRGDDRIPLGLALDGYGQGTESASAALDGSVLPAGGHKGFALTLLLEVLASVMSGAAFSTDIPDYRLPHRPKRLGHFALAMRTDLLMESAEFTRRIEHLASMIREQPAAVGSVQAPRLPGQRAARMRAHHYTTGLVVEPDVRDLLKGIADGLGVSLPSELIESN